DTAFIARILSAASAREKNTAERAFWRDTSAPNTGASGVRACARTLPSKSTIVAVIWAKLLVGMRIAARAENATLRVLTIIACASAAVIAVPSVGTKPFVGP